MKRRHVPDHLNEVAEIFNQQVNEHDLDIDPHELDSTSQTGAGRDRVGFVGIRRHVKSNLKDRY